MIKINITENIVDEFYLSIKKLFDNKLKKIENKKENFNISYSDIDTLINKKLNNFDKDINLEKLVKADYKYMKKLVDFINKNPKRHELSKIEKKYFFTMYERLQKAEFIKKINIQTCPYCNRNYIFNFTRNNKQEATAQLDHFFDKSKYPYLAVSIYNLVPSCNVCNQRKSSKQEDIFYPYEESFNDSVKFKYNYENLSKIKIEFDIKYNEEKVNNHIEIFNLEHLYNEHKDIVLELIQKREIYPDSYIDELTNQYPNMFNNKEDVLRLITCGYVDDKDLHKRPLSKLIKDISEQLELI